ncbi:MAG: hypothetical protein JO166_03370 [Deltaproteobacteria bacterium]|nr:hypothetical protein [Deltaproteobacteria bacterium]
MRIGKIIAALVLPVLILFALVASTSPVRLWAQLPPSNPNLGPAATPSAPPQLSQPAATIGIPPLAVIPTPRAPTPVAAARTFNCSCFGPGSGTHWMGRVSASGYFAARQSAVHACLADNQRTQVASPFIPPSAVGGAAIAQSGALGPQALPGADLPVDAAAAQELPGVPNFSTAAQLRMCSQCTCD